MYHEKKGFILCLFNSCLLITFGEDLNCYCTFSVIIHQFAAGNFPLGVGINLSVGCHKFLYVGKKKPAASKCATGAPQGVPGEPRSFMERP